MVTIDGRPGVELSDDVLGAQIFDAYSGTFFIPWAVELAPGASVALELDDTSGPHDQTFYTVADCHVFPTPPGLSLTVPAALTVEATSPAGAWSSSQSRRRRRRRGATDRVREAEHP